MKIGTRGSELALWQARHVRALLQEAAGVECELVVIKTSGDRDLDTPFVGMEGKGFFTKEIEDALLAHQIDIAVHSLKDLQTIMPDGLMLGAVPERADRRDVLLIRPDAFDRSLPLRIKSGAKVGTSSARRVAQLRFLRPDLDVEPLRGNVPTRVRKLSLGRYDAILAAAAGLDRLELSLDQFNVYRLPEMLVLPAPGQGALGIQIRADDPVARDLIARLDHPEIREIVAIEREVLRLLEGGCQLALGTAAEKTPSGVRLAAFLGNDDFAHPRHVVIGGKDKDNVVSTCVSYLRGEKRLAGRTANVWITREPQRAGSFVEPLERRAQVTAVPTFLAVEAGDRALQHVYLGRLASYDWVFFTSRVTVHEFARLLREHKVQFGAATRIAAVGAKTASAVHDAGWRVDFIADVPDASALAEQFGQEHKGLIGKVLFPCGQAASKELEGGLPDGVSQFDRMVCYDMARHPELNSVVAGLADPEAIAFTSPQAARFLLSARPLSAVTVPVSIGQATTEALLQLGCPIVYETLDRSLEGLAEVINGLLAA